MNTPVIYGLLIPFVGTSLGAACVFFLKKGLGDRVQRGLTGFASGVMVAASIWSLLIPAMEQSAGGVLYVVVEELIPEMSQGKHSNVGTLGFTLMRALDVALD